MKIEELKTFLAFNLARRANITVTMEDVQDYFDEEKDDVPQGFEEIADLVNIAFDTAVPSMKPEEIITSCFPELAGEDAIVDIVNSYSCDRDIEDLCKLYCEYAAYGADNHVLYVIETLMVSLSLEDGKVPVILCTDTKAYEAAIEDCGDFVNYIENCMIDVES